MGTNIFKLNPDGNYQIVDYVKSDDEVDKETFAKVKAAYPDVPGNGLPLEMKMLRIGVANPQDASFVAYNNFVNQCRADGVTAKAANAAKLASLKQVPLPGGRMGEEIYVRE